MTFQFAHPTYLLLLPVALAWVIWLAVRSDVQVSKWRRWLALAVRIIIVAALVLALAGLQWRKKLEGMNVYYLLDQSLSIPSGQQDAAREYINKAMAGKKAPDKAGLIVFGSEANIDLTAKEQLPDEKPQAVVGKERTDIASAIQLGTAGFPENGQKRLVLMSDGNENVGDAMTALLTARDLGVSLDVLPMGVERGNDVSVQKLTIPPKLKEGQVFEGKITIQSDQASKAMVSVNRDDKLISQQEVELSAGKNLLTFPDTLPQSGFYKYDVHVEAPGDSVPQNNSATAFANVKGQPEILIVSSDPEVDQALNSALQNGQVKVRMVGSKEFPATLAELVNYDSILLVNVPAGDLGRDAELRLESAVRDFGVGLVCIGGEQAYAAGGYRGTPLEETLPVSMELDSKKVLPKGAVVLVMHGMEFANGNQVARDCAQGVLAALGPQDEMGVVLWDGTEHWLFPLTPAGDKKELSRQIAGMNQGDLPTFQGVLSLAHEGLKKSGANLKHIIVFSDGDPGAPSQALMDGIVADNITVSTVLIAGHAGPDNMTWIASQGKGTFYNISSPDELPQIFIKETAVILKSAIFEEQFKPQVQSMTEPIRGIGAADYPDLLGYVATTPKPRAELPMVSDKGDPLLAHWIFGLGRAVAFTSDARAKWAKNWISWSHYRQFWSQIAQWSLRRLENADLMADVSVNGGEGQISVEALDEQDNYRNFLNLEAAVVSPKGERMTVPVKQTGPGHYEARFPTKEVGTYMVNLLEKTNDVVARSQRVGASIDYSPEFNTSEPNLSLLRRLAESGGGKMLDMEKATDGAFSHDREKTFQPRDLWEWLLKLSVLLFPLDVAIRRIQLDREEMARAWRKVRGWVIPGVPREAEAEESLAALLSRRDRVRSSHTGPAEARPELFQPMQPAILPKAGEEVGSAGLALGSRPVAAESEAEAPKSEETTTTSRLLEAKRRAQKRKE